MVQIPERVDHDRGFWAQDGGVLFEFIGHALVLLNVDPPLGRARFDEMVGAQEPSLHSKTRVVDLSGPIPERSRSLGVGFQGGRSRTNYATCT